MTEQLEQATAYAAASFIQIVKQLKAMVIMNKEVKETTTGLNRFTVYKESELRSEGYRFASLKTNRTPQKNALNKKKKSISKVGVLSSCTVVHARKCLLQRLEVIDEAGMEVTSEASDLDKILVIVDGGHRFEAVKELNLKRSESDRIECYFTLPFNDNVPVYELLRQSNIVTTPWGGSTYLSSLIMAKDEAAKNLMLKWVEKLSTESGETAKTQLIRASGDDEKAKDAYSKISDTSNFEAGKRLYEAFRKHFKAAVLGCKFFPEWVIERFDELKDAKGKSAAVETLVKFAESFDRDTVDVIEEFKGTDRGKLAKSKLSELYSGVTGTETSSKTDAV